LGKAAAQAPTQSKIGTSPDDDGQPRVSWRGDAAFYVVSTLSQQTPRHRVLRVYDIQGRLQSTSEAVAGVEHVLSWRPSGNLIASTQRFGFEGGGQGKEGRHDVVFFERNGLRHGEFTLPVSVPKSETSKWGYKVQELSWSPDSDVLAVWIRFDTHDVGETLSGTLPLKFFY
jgi:elongator complex protein 1